MHTLQPEYRSRDRTCCTTVTLLQWLRTVFKAIWHTDMVVWLTYIPGSRLALRQQEDLLQMNTWEMVVDVCMMTLSDPATRFPQTLTDPMTTETMTQWTAGLSVLQVTTLSGVYHSLSLFHHHKADLLLLFVSLRLHYLVYVRWAWQAVFGHLELKPASNNNQSKRQPTQVECYYCTETTRTASKHTHRHRHAHTRTHSMFDTRKQDTHNMFNKVYKKRMMGDR